MQTVSRVYDTYAQARNAVTAVEAAGVPTSEVSLVANKYVSDKYADVDEVSAPAKGAGIGGAIGGGAGLLAGLGLLAIPGLVPSIAGGGVVIQGWDEHPGSDSDRPDEAGAFRA